MTSIINKQKEIIEDLKNTKIENPNLISPYVICQLEIPIELKAFQMDNNIYQHLKDNLIKMYEKKCMKSYGYIEKIYSIEEIDNGIIEFENMSCSAIYKCKFNCKLCIPIVQKEIICKIEIYREQLGIAINGGIKASILPYKINKNNFYTDQNLEIRIKQNSELLKKDDYIKILVTQLVFSDKDTNIIVVGFLQDMATVKEIEMYTNEFI